MSSVPRFREWEFKGEYPLAELRFRDDDFPGEPKIKTRVPSSRADSLNPFL